jgi:hypothetical protein
VIDREGVIRLQLNNAEAIQSEAASVLSILNRLIEEKTVYGDAGALIPDVFLLISAKIIDLTGLPDASQIAALIDIELKKIDPAEPVLIIASPKK